MPQCRVCQKQLPHKTPTCPRCGFQEISYIGDPTKAEEMNNQRASAHLEKYLANFDFGITVYHWKDQNGTIALDRKARMSFGNSVSLMGKTVWLEQPFARIPDLEHMELELSILCHSKDYRTIPITIPVPKGNHLQQVGISLERDLSVRLSLKNPQERTQSSAVPFLSE